MPGRSILFSATTIGHAGGAGVADGFFGLRHDAVVGGDDQHGDIGDVGAAGTHFGEGFVAGGIDEGDFSAVAFDLVGADVLRDAAAFAAGDVDADDLIQQRRFAVVDVAQERDDRRARLELIGFVGHRIDEIVKLFLGGLGLLQFDFGAELGGQQFDGFGIDWRHDVGHGAGIECQQLAQDLTGGNAQRFGKAAHGGGQLQDGFAFAGCGGVGAGAFDALVGRAHDGQHRRLPRACRCLWLVRRRDVCD